MSDFNSSLPIRTQSNGDAAVKIVDGTVTSQQLGVDSGGRITTKISDGTDQLGINTDGSININLRDESGTAYSSTNPLQVVMIESEGDEINNYSTATVASSATSNHDYTVTALKTLQLTQIEGAASGKMKIEVQVETGVATGSFNTRFVKFNSTANPNMSISLREPIAVAAGVRVRVIRTNLDNQSQDLYTTISGHEV
jgi:hypothetical protein